MEMDVGQDISLASAPKGAAAVPALASLPTAVVYTPLAVDASLTYQSAASDLCATSRDSKQSSKVFFLTASLKEGALTLVRFVLATAVVVLVIVEFCIFNINC
jgi:hypothetical protein